MSRRIGLTVLIPARGGSKGIPDKNLQPVNRLPLVVHTARTAGKVAERVVVSTDSPRIEAICQMHGIETIRRAEQLADDEATVDDLVAWHLTNHHVDYPLLVLQPTVPEITATDLSTFVDAIDAANYRAAAMSTPTHHLLWTDRPLQSRTNRQTSKPIWQEIGVRYHRQPPADPPNTIWHLNRPIIDIDTYDDLTLARRHLERGEVVFDYLAGGNYGWGHKTRCETLAAHLTHHKQTHPVAYDVAPVWGRGVWVFDRLDTSVEQVTQRAAAGWKTVCLEDRGPGARHADAVVNALYPIGRLPQEHAGSDWTVLRTEFIGLSPRSYDGTGRILVSFGGTDPAGLTDRIAGLLGESDFDVQVVEPPSAGGGVPSMAAAMRRADLIVTSAGRTLYEAAATGTPAVSIAANAKETGHAHLGVGNLFLGHHALVSDDLIKRTVTQMMVDSTLREDVGLQGFRSVDGKGTA
jgi:spore coat polysaccharide biosynthesis predicted glycosyltransferase SpsG